MTERGFKETMAFEALALGNQLVHGNELERAQVQYREAAGMFEEAAGDANAAGDYGKQGTLEDMRAMAQANVRRARDNDF